MAADSCGAPPLSFCSIDSRSSTLDSCAHPTAAGWDVFTALLPAAEQDNLFRGLGSATRGTAWFEVAFDHYEEVGAKDVKRAEAAQA